MFVSAFDLFRVGLGPSSAHTTGPMRAARRFVHTLEADGVFFQARRIHVDLYGSIACSGRDQGTDRAIVAGLCGDAPDAVDPRTLNARSTRIRTEGQLPLNGTERIPFDPTTDLVFHVDKSFAQQNNAMRFTAQNARGETLATHLYFSTGDGEIVAHGEVPGARSSIRVPYTFASAEELLALGQSHGKKIAEMSRTNEQALRSPGEVRAGLLHFAATMRNAVERGLTSADDSLPGGRPRRAATQAAAIAGTDPLLPAWAAVFATAVAEENAAGGRVVAAPSNGSAGPIAAVLHQWRSTHPLAGDDGSVTFLLAAAAIGQLLRINELKQTGCQGEVGVASAMAAAGLAAVNSGSNRQVLYAAERALEPFLGLTCDPSGGLVQDPCIARNAAAAAHAVESARLALRLPEPPRIGLDIAIRAMAEKGHSMASRYKASSLGGLAVNVVDC